MASSSTVAALKELRYHEASCSICFESLFGGKDSLGDDMPYSMIECGHFFHTHCISTWFEQPNTKVECPKCRKALANRRGLFVPTYLELEEMKVMAEIPEDDEDEGKETKYTAADLEAIGLAKQARDLTNELVTPQNRVAMASHPSRPIWKTGDFDSKIVKADQLVQKLDKGCSKAVVKIVKPYFEKLKVTLEKVVEHYDRLKAREDPDLSDDGDEDDEDADEPEDRSHEISVLEDEVAELEARLDSESAIHNEEMDRLLVKIHELEAASRRHQTYVQTEVPRQIADARKEERDSIVRHVARADKAEQDYKAERTRRKADAAAWVEKEEDMKRQMREALAGVEQEKNAHLRSEKALEERTRQLRLNQIKIQRFRDKQHGLQAEIKQLKAQLAGHDAPVSVSPKNTPEYSPSSTPSNSQEILRQIVRRAKHASPQDESLLVELPSSDDFHEGFSFSRKPAKPKANPTARTFSFDLGDTVGATPVAAKKSKSKAKSDRRDPLKEKTVVPARNNVLKRKGPVLVPSTPSKRGKGVSGKWTREGRIECIDLSRSD